MKYKAKLSIISVLVTWASTNNVNANEQICIEQTSKQSQKKIIETYMKNYSPNEYESIQYLKKANPELAKDVIISAAVDINNDGKEEIFYILGHPMSGSSGYDIKALFNPGNGKWNAILENDPYSGCFMLLNSLKGGYRDIVNLDTRSGEPASKCVFDPKQKKYICKPIRSK